MQSVTLVEAQKRLAELVHGLNPNGELLITEADRPVAKLSSVRAQTSLRNLRPSSVGTILRPLANSDDDILGEMLDHSK